MILKISVGKCNFSQNTFHKTFTQQGGGLLQISISSRAQSLGNNKLRVKILLGKTYLVWGWLFSVCISIIWWATAQTQGSVWSLNVCLCSSHLRQVKGNVVSVLSRYLFSLRELDIILTSWHTLTAESGWHWEAHPAPPLWDTAPWSGRERRGSPGPLQLIWRKKIFLESKNYLHSSQFMNMLFVFAADFSCVSMSRCQACSILKSKRND